MKQFEEQKFNIPTLKGLSAKSIEEHLKLYSGYVKNANLILEQIEELAKDGDKNIYAMAEMQRRFGFEFNGMRNHEFYFTSLSDQAAPLTADSRLRKQIEADFGSFDPWLLKFKSLATTRGVGWAMLYYDPASKRLLNGWVDEQHLGQLNGCQTILALDMWEHSFVFDYQPSGKKKYIEDFFVNLNWDAIEKNFSATAK